MQMKKQIGVIGGGAAGMMAGVYLARAGHEVHILEKNEKLGKKVYITGTVSYTHLTLPTICSV